SGAPSAGGGAGAGPGAPSSAGVANARAPAGGRMRAAARRSDRAAMGCTLCTPAGTGSPGAAGPVPQGRGYAWPVRRAAAIPWLPLVLALAGCMGAPARVPDGITVVEERAPPPPPALV